MCVPLSLSLSLSNWQLHALAVHPQCHMASYHSLWYNLSIDGKHQCRKQRPLTSAILAIPVYFIVTLLLARVVFTFFFPLRGGSILCATGRFYRSL